MCRVEGAEEFFSELSRTLGSPIEVPPTHITLYTLRNGWPIGIYNKQRLDGVTRKLTNPRSSRNWKTYRTCQRHKRTQLCLG